MSEESIFASLAPLYWEAGYPAIPLYRASKRPIPTAWQEYSSKEVPEEIQKHWLSQCADGNIGLALGRQAGVVMIDIDSEDPAVIAVLQKLLPPSPWERRGRKGVMLAYKWGGQKTFRIKNAAGEMMVELLSDRTQCVLPGSIHPDTGVPYVADSDLYDPDVRAHLQALPPDLEAILRTALEANGVVLSLSGHTRVTDYVPKGARDVQMVSVAGLYAYAVLRGERTFKEAIGMMAAWYSAQVEKVAGDEIDVAKGICKIAEFMIRDVTGPKGLALPEGWDKDLDAAERTAFGFDIFTEENVKWGFDELKEYLKNQFLTHDVDTQGRRDAVEYFLARLAHSGLNQLDEERLIVYLAQTSQLGVSVTALRARLREIRTSGTPGLDHTQIAKAVLGELNQNGALVFHNGGFWQWNGSHWGDTGRDPDSPEGTSANMNVVILKTIAHHYGHLPMAKRQSDHSSILRLMQTLAERDLSSSSAEGVNFANGFLTPYMELIDHDQSHGCTYTLPYRYIPELSGRANRFEEFIESCWGQDADYIQKKQALQEAMAVTLFRIAPQFERVICLHGPGKSGKSQVLKIVSSMLPANSVAAVGPEFWGDKFLPAQMAGKLLNVAGELSERRTIDGMRFKQIVSGELITGQHKNQSPFQFRVQCAHWFATNHVPRTEDTSQGFNRRWLLLTFTKPVSDDNKILDLGTLIVADEREAIAAWAVEAMPRLQAAREFTLPPSHKERIEEVARMNNSLRSFLLDSGKVLAGSVVASSSIPITELDIYNAYYTFAIAAGVARPVSLVTFRQKMRELGSELGFKLRLVTNQAGVQECLYESLTLVPGSQGSMSKRRGTQ